MTFTLWRRSDSTQRLEAAAKALRAMNDAISVRAQDGAFEPKTEAERETIVNMHTDAMDAVCEMTKRIAHE